MFKIEVDYEIASCLSDRDRISTIVSELPTLNDLLHCARTLCERTPLEERVDRHINGERLDPLFINEDGECVYHIEVSSDDQSTSIVAQIVVTKHTLPVRYTGLPDLCLANGIYLIGLDEDAKKFALERLEYMVSAISRKFPNSKVEFDGKIFTPASVFNDISRLGGLYNTNRASSEDNHKHAALLAAYDHFWIKGNV